MADTLEDFIAKYRNTFVFVKQKNSVILAEFQDCDGEKLFFNSQDLGGIQLNFKTALDNLIIKFPQKGLYNVSNTLFSFFYRIPEKQFKRSPCNNNSKLIQVGTKEPQHLNFQNMMNCFYPTYPDTKMEAMKQIADRGGVALNDKIGLTYAGDGNVYDVWYYNNIVATIQKDKLTVHYDPLTQELKDYFGDDLTWK